MLIYLQMIIAFFLTPSFEFNAQNGLQTSSKSERKKSLFFPITEPIRDKVKIKKRTQHGHNLKASESSIVILSDGAAGRRCRREVRSAAGQFAGAAVPANSVSKTDCASIQFMFYVLQSICFTLYIERVSGLHSIYIYINIYICTRVLIAPAEHWKMIATAVPSVCGCKKEKKKGIK